MKPESIQAQMNKIDRELLVLLQERMGLFLRSTKTGAADPEAALKKPLLADADQMNLDLIESGFSNRLLQIIIEESQRLKNEDRPLVAFQGEHGAYGEVAARRLVPGGAYIPCLEFNDVFDGVENGQFDLGVVPVENSLEGAVTQVNDLLTTTGLKIQGEAKVPVKHCLLAPETTDYRDIRMVYSHPQALAQCREFLMRNKLEPRPYYDTAGAAKMLARENPKAAAAIASSLSAELYNLNIIKEGVEDGPSNRTRFLLMSREGAAGGNKTSVIFCTPHKAGSLYSVLRLFAENNINLTRIASMPLRSDPENYSFFLDFEGAAGDAPVDDVLQKMTALTISLKQLGTYPADEA